ncbi:MAG: phage major tail protein, TP901-1 family [Henriciella sp.]
MMGRKGRDILLKISDGKDPENFVTLAGIRSREISLNARPVDVTNADSPDGWRELLVGAAVKSVRIAGRGVFKDADSDQRMRAVFLSGADARWQLVLPGAGHITGAMQITALGWGGAHDGEASFSLEIESAGPMVFEGGNI